jgi:hypothetical protein
MFGLPYRRNATEGSVSPATRTCVSCAVNAPEVGFWPPISPAISSMVTVQIARTGVPLGVNSVYFAVTLLTYAANPVRPPHRKITHGGEPFFCDRLSGVGTQHSNSFSTALTTESSILSVLSKNISRPSLAGSEPVNSGTPLFLAPRCASRRHFALLERLSSFGLNWKSMRPRTGPGLAVLPPLPGSRTSRYACSSFGGAPSMPPTEGGAPAALNEIGDAAIRPADSGRRTRGGPVRASRWRPWAARG